MIRARQAQPVAPMPQAKKSKPSKSENSVNAVARTEGSRIIIDDAFKLMIPPLSEDEFRQLEENIVAHGCRDPLTVWDSVLLDGHNRYEICTRLNIPFAVVTVELPDRAAAEDWIDANQLGRRNLTPDSFKLLLGRRYNRTKKAVNDGGKGTPKATVVQNEPRSTAAKLAKEHGTSEATVKRAAKFAEEVEKSPELAQAIQARKPVAQVKKEMKRQKAVETSATITEQNKPLPVEDRKYSVIYADPPWSFEVWSGEGKDRAAENHYPTMDQTDIEALPVSKLAADDCVLFLWAVMPQLPEALSVIKAWGFEYKTCAFVWVKTTKDGERPATGMGYWTRANAEVCLLATKGSPVRLNADVHQVVMSPRAEHSRKPDEIAERIARLVPGPYLEMFARASRAGWDVWGNQAPGHQDSA